jgi:hypothetical protein
MQVQTLGRYRVLKELGRGAMGRVLLAHDPEIDRQVAIKTIQIFASLPEGERLQARQRFLREARSTGKLLHPGIVTLFDVGEEEGVPYLAMEYVVGTTLDAFCSKDSLLPVETVVEIGAKLAEALAFAHATGIVHRDVKPANVMRVGGTEVKIMDFGLAKSAETQLTHDGSLLGTPNYMSPEQIRGEEIDGRSDLFSLAVLVYEMLTGEKPFPGDSISAVLYRIVNERPAAPSPQSERVPQPVAAFLDRALAKRAQDRFASGNEFAAALRRAHQAGREKPPAAGAPAPRTKAPIPPPPPVRPAAARRWPYFVGALGVAALVALGLALQGSLGGGRTPAPVVPVSLEARVRTDPPGLPVALDGKPVEAGIARFSPTAPFGTLTATAGCRTASHALDASDQGREIVLVPDPTTAAVLVDPGVSGATLTLDGKEAGTSPASLTLDLCKESRIEVTAAGYRAASTVVPAGATPTDARTLAAAIRLEAIPKGTLVLPKTRTPVTFFVDGKEVRAGGGIELFEGTHELRASNEESLVDVSTSFEVKGNEEVRPRLAIPPLATLVIQAFPPNCQAYVKRKGGEWIPLDDTPVRRDVAAGSYVVKVAFVPTGESRELEVTLAPGANPPLKFAFRRPGR